MSTKPISAGSRGIVKTRSFEGSRTLSEHDPRGQVKGCRITSDKTHEVK